MSQRRSSIPAGRFSHSVAVVCAIVLLVCALQSVRGVTAVSATTRRPSPTQVRSTIRKVFSPIYGRDDGLARAATIRFGFGRIRFGRPAASSSCTYCPRITVYPVQVHVHITVTYSNNPVVNQWDRGVAINDVFIFSLDSFGNWTFTTGPAP
jgi:hypothetical protein